MPAVTRAAHKSIVDKYGVIRGVSPQGVPYAIKKLTKGYEMRVWWFEIFECFRKLAIACLPVFFQPAGSPGQLVFGLLVCFIAFGAYVAIDPFDDDGNDVLAKICQAQIFFSLLSAVLLSYDPATIADSSGLDLLLVVLWIMPLVLAVFMQSPIAMAIKKLAVRRRDKEVNEAEKKVAAATGGPRRASTAGAWHSIGAGEVNPAEDPAKEAEVRQAV